MRAVAVVPGQSNSLHVLDVPTPARLDNEATVRVLEAGFCGTDLEIHQGLYGTSPTGSSYLILGHENLGVVESAPLGSSLAPGDLVVATVRRPCPQLCVPCRAGHNDMCVTGDYFERGIKGLHGFMCDVYTESPLDLVAVPAALRDVAVLVEPMTVAQKSLERAFQMQDSTAWAPRTAVVLGAGPIGMLAAASLRLRGFEVTVGSREAEGSARAAYLAEAGIRFRSTASMALLDWPRQLGAFDLVFEATGAAAVVFPAISLLGPDGICVLSSVTSGEKPVTVDAARFNHDIMMGNRVVFGTVSSGRRHFEAAVRDLAAAEERLPGWVGRMVTRRLAMSEVHRAFERGPDDIKTVLRFD